MIQDSVGVLIVGDPSTDVLFNERLTALVDKVATTHGITSFAVPFYMRSDLVKKCPAIRNGIIKSFKLIEEGKSTYRNDIPMYVIAYDGTDTKTIKAFRNMGAKVHCVKEHASKSEDIVSEWNSSAPKHLKGKLVERALSRGPKITQYVKFKYDGESLYARKVKDGWYLVATMANGFESRACIGKKRKAAVFKEAGEAQTALIYGMTFKQNTELSKAI